MDLEWNLTALLGSLHWLAGTGAYNCGMASPKLCLQRIRVVLREVEGVK